jgi:hypothetical protein
MGPTASPLRRNAQPYAFSPWCPNHTSLVQDHLSSRCQKHADSFPAPFHEGSSALWHLAPLLQWLKARDGYEIEQSLLDVARTATQINLTKEASQLERRVQRAVLELVE